MRSRRTSGDQVAEVARRRLELLSAELAEIRPGPVDPPSAGAEGGSGELFHPDPVEPTAGGPGRHAHRPAGLGVAVAGWTQDRLPATLQGRVRLTGAHLAVVLLMVLGGVGMTGWWVSRADGGSTALPPVAAVSSGPSPLATASSPAAATPSPPVGAPGSPSASGRIVVDVAGKVRRPGIATLPAGSRVVDAVKAAGGARHGAPLGSLNLARVLTDGEQIVVGLRVPTGVVASSAPGSTTGSTASAVPMVNINTADQAQLEELPGVGPVTAQSILDYRAERGTFTAVDELLEVSGIGDVTLAKISPYCTL